MHETFRRGEGWEVRPPSFYFVSVDTASTGKKLFFNKKLFNVSRGPDVHLVDKSTLLFIFLLRG